MKKNIKVVNGNAKDLKFSPVFDHLNAVKPKTSPKKGSIIIPEVKKDKKK